MAEFFYVYVGQESTANFEIGQGHGIWGWRSDALDSRRGPDRLTNREIARSIHKGDYLVFGYRGSPGPRSQEHEFLTARLRRVLVTRVRRGLYWDEVPVWPDDVYPERVDITVVRSLEAVAGTELGPDAMRALKSSGTRRGVPVEGPPLAT